MVELARKDKLPPVIKGKAISIGEKMLTNFSTIVGLDLPMAFGSDTGVSSHGDNWREFVLLVEIGKMSPIRAFQLATVEAAKLLKKETEFGTIETGKSADIIALPRSVLNDIHLVNQVKFVMKEGIIYKKNGKSVHSCGVLPN